MRSGGRGDQEQPDGAARGAYGGNRLSRHLRGEVVQAARRLLGYFSGPIGMVVDDQRLPSAGEGGEFPEVGVLDGPRAGRGNRMHRPACAVVRIGEDQVTPHGRGKRLVRPRRHSMVRSAAG
jgi:hypothetical protein